MPRKTTSKDDGSHPERVPVTLEPKDGYSDEDVMLALHSKGASEVEVLAPGFISALALASSLEALHAVAEVHPKARKQPH